MTTSDAVLIKIFYLVFCRVVALTNNEVSAGQN